jgi:catechol 2,3-dioxygenase-like lactoylglutathione lyase family enzyme
MVFCYCNDLEAMRSFYTDLIGMAQRGYSAEHGFLTYTFGGGEMMFFASEQELPVNTEWGDQPGYQGGRLKVTSWAIDVPEAIFPEVIKRLKQAGVKSHTPDPEWRFESYWGINVMDPMGNTVELYTIPAQKPDSTQWSQEN